MKGSFSEKSQSEQHLEPLRSSSNMGEAPLSMTISAVKILKSYLFNQAFLIEQLHSNLSIKPDNPLQVCQTAFRESRFLIICAKLYKQMYILQMLFTSWLI